MAFCDALRLHGFGPCETNIYLLKLYIIFNFYLLTITISKFSNSFLLGEENLLLKTAYFLALQYFLNAVKLIY